jgi:hypothetical protein
MSKFAPRQSPCNIGIIPDQENGARYLAVSLPFTSSVLVIADDLVLENENGTIANVQSMYFDTSGTDATSIAIKFLESGQVLTFPKNFQGFVPVLCHQQVLYQVTCAGGTNYGPVNLFFLNFPVAPQVWTT